jgi:repressor LexA
MDKGTRIKNLRENAGYGQEELGKKIGVSKQTMYKYENNIVTNIPSDKIEAIAKIFNVSPAYLMGWSDNVVPTKLNRDVVSIPVLGSVPAGVPVEAIEDIIDTIEIPREWVDSGAQFIGLRVAGTSMYPMYLDGDTVVIEVKHDCESGQDAIIYVNGYDATLKTVIKNADGTITLKPRNPEWQAKTYGPGDDPIEILGPVVQMQRDV